MNRFIQTLILLLTAVSLLCCPVLAKETARRIDTACTLNGREVEFSAYDVSGYKCMRAEDLAVLLRGTPCRFKPDLKDNVLTVKKGKNFKKDYARLTANIGGITEESLTVPVKVKCGKTETSFNANVINGQYYFRLRDIASVIGMTLKWQENGSVLTFEKSVSDVTQITRSPSEITELADFMVGDYWNTVSKYCIAQIKGNKKYSSIYSDKNFFDRVSPMISNFTDFTLDKENVTFTIDTSDLGDKKTETIDVSIPYTALDEHIRTKLKPLAAVVMIPIAELKESMMTSVIMPIVEGETMGTTTSTSTESTTEKATVDPDKPMIALTFDDGPRINSTEKIVDALAAVDGRATFFVVGSMVDKHPELVKKAVDAGCQIGNHSYDHLDLKTLSTYDIKYQVNKTSNAVYDASGEYPRIGRPPYGSVNNKVRETVSIPWFNWNFDTLDWKYRDADYVYNTVIENAKDGQVILMHDLHTSTADAMVRAIPKLHEMGFQLVTIDEMAQAYGGYDKVPGYIKEQ